MRRAEMKQNTRKRIGGLSRLWHDEARLQFDWVGLLSDLRQSIKMQRNQINSENQKLFKYCKTDIQRDNEAD